MERQVRCYGEPENCDSNAAYQAADTLYEYEYIAPLFTCAPRITFRFSTLYYPIDEIGTKLSERFHLRYWKDWAVSLVCGYLKSVTVLGMRLNFSTAIGHPWMLAHSERHRRLGGNRLRSHRRHP